MCHKLAFGACPGSRIMGNEENQKNVKEPTPKIFQILDFGDFGELQTYAGRAGGA